MVFAFCRCFEFCCSGCFATISRIIIIMMPIITTVPRMFCVCFSWLLDVLILGVLFSSYVGTYSNGEAWIDDYILKNFSIFMFFLCNVCARDGKIY